MNEIFKGYSTFINCKNNENNAYNCYKKKVSVQHDHIVCRKCGIDYYKIYNDSNNNNSFVNCYKYPDGYYLDINNCNYKQCYSSCKTCNQEGNEIFHNCLECNNDYIIEINKGLYKNCYKLNNDNLKKYMRINETDIDLGECENKLKSVYNISDNSSLYIIRYDITIERMLIPKVEYEVFYLSDESFMELNLIHCKGL